MTRLYEDPHRALQEAFDSRDLADAVEKAIVATDVEDEHKAFIESRDMFFLATVDGRGRPTVSYKGGDPGFVRVIDPRTVVFPSFNGNGMFLSMGNIAGASSIGMLFIDFETPHRLRLQGEATVAADDPLVAEFPGAELVVRVAVSEIWVNCPRYIHRYRKLDPSRYVPREDCETPIAEWKKLDMIQDALPEADRRRVAAIGETITEDEYKARLLRGEA